MTMPSKAKNVQLFDLHHSTLGQFLKELLGSIPGYHASQVLLARYMPGGLQFQSLGFSSQAEMTNFKRESKLQLDDAFRPVQTLSAVFSATTGVLVQTNGLDYPCNGHWAAA